MFGDKADKRGDGIQKPPWNPNRIFVAQTGNTKVGIDRHKSPGTNTGVLPFIYMKGQTVGNVPEKP